MNVLIEGLAIGSVYCLIAFSFMIEFRIRKFFNFTILAYLVLAPLVVSEIAGENGSIFLLCLAIAISVIIIVLLSYLQDRIVFRSITHISSSAKSLCSLSLLLLYISLIDMIWSSRNTLKTPLEAKTVVIGNSYFLYYDFIVTSAFVVLLAGLFLLSFHTRAGKRIRSFANDSYVAKAYGVSTEIVTIAISLVVACLVSVAGVFQKLDVSSFDGYSSYLVVSIVAVSILMVSKGFDFKICLLLAFFVSFIQLLVREKLSTFNSFFDSVSSIFGIDTNIKLDTTFSNIFVPLILVILIGALSPKKLIKREANA